MIKCRQLIEEIQSILDIPQQLMSNDQMQTIDLGNQYEFKEMGEHSGHPQITSHFLL